MRLMKNDSCFPRNMNEQSNQTFHSEVEYKNNVISTFLIVFIISMCRNSCCYFPFQNIIFPDQLLEKQ